MKQLTVTQSLRWLMLACCVAAVYVAVVAGLTTLAGWSTQATVVSAFVATAVCVTGFGTVERQINRWLDRGIRHKPLTRYGALVAAGARVPALGSVERALPGLAEVLAEGTRSRHASVWVLVPGRLIRAAAWPPDPDGSRPEVADLASLHTAVGIDHVIPVVDGDSVRGALAITKSGPASVTDDDDSLMRDVANCCGLLFRNAALDAELRNRVRRAEELGGELRASQNRLTHAREAERRRLANEITTVTTGSLAAIRAELRHLEEALAAGPASAERVLSRLRSALDELIERFRAVVRGVYPGVLRHDGPRAALEELAGDLPRPVRFTGQLRRRVDWEVESGIYYVAASAMQLLGRGPSMQPLHVHLDHHDAKLSVMIDDSPTAVAPSADLRATFADDGDRLTALGGGMSLDETPTRISVRAWLPEKLEPVVAGPAEAPAVDAVDLRSAKAPVADPSGEDAATDTALAPLEQIRRLIVAASEEYAQDPVGDALLEIANRLDEPLRVALVGRVGSGKSTLVNALLGEELAPTDVRECTPAATWYRGSSTCTITLYPRAGTPRPLEFAATGAAAAVSLGDVALETVDHLVVDWPSPALRAMTLIDLPGTDSLRTNGSEQARALITPARHGIPTVDAIVYLTRRMQTSDIRFLQDIRDDPRWRGAVAVVLTRADEAGRARPNALEASERISAKYRRDPRVRQVCQTVLPVAALLAASGATLRESEYEALRQLSALEGPESDTALLSADKFTHADTPNTPGSADRAGLLERFGIFGVRLAIGLIREGKVSGPAQLRDALLRHSGVEQLRDLLTTQLAARVDALTARSALLAMDAVLTGLPAADLYRDLLLYETERIRVGAHEFTEIDLIDSLRCGHVTFPNEDIALAERILGADGTDPFTRLGLSPEAGAVAVEHAAALTLARWQQHAENPLLTRDASEACRAVIRACEGLLQYSRSVRTE